MNGDGQLNHPEIGSEMAPGGRNLLNQEPPDLMSQIVKFIITQGYQITRARQVR